MSSFLGLNAAIQNSNRHNTASIENSIVRVADRNHPQVDGYQVASLGGGNLSTVRVKAASTLQAAFRSARSRRALAELRSHALQESAATQLAAQWRGYKTRQAIREVATEVPKAPRTQVHFLGQTHWADEVEEMDCWEQRKAILSIVRSQVQIANFLLQNALEGDCEIYAEGLAKDLSSEMAWRPTRLALVPPPREPGFYLPQNLVREIRSNFSDDPQRFPRHPRHLTGREQLMTLAKYGAARVLCVLGIINEVKAAITIDEQDRIYEEMNAYTHKRAGLDIFKFMSRYPNWAEKHPELRALVYDAREACLIEKLKASDCEKNKIVIFGKNHDFGAYVDTLSQLEAKPHFY